MAIRPAGAISAAFLFETPPDVLRRRERRDLRRLAGEVDVINRVPV
jgi:hypothetical protein